MKPDQATPAARRLRAALPLLVGGSANSVTGVYVAVIDDDGGACGGV